MVAKNIDNCEKTIDLYPIGSLMVVLNIVTLATL
jgi:hypothetical protein